ncbi:hypothetical protein TBLA_0A00645 [Henningerozyma blattae CBS 6284]|uniref:Uncharacterized protein n=1 Tax=Henningerozyma blattae (strain ATCC 34711 / CBS 6284 / DSM 70876 / NBRC 10599 / NRRL Y-10934 / UCD 77-7) TaxID=1071380 RepID=I2GUR4_HENB6|nr:hypothetical protein TBLA_0A00645 [Tetrapisispora blattae CBS 6284]CCH57866.1 hypothetical protein TBLA_0A00645 [Tetrapisispora blattae CBS 6284]
MTCNNSSKYTNSNVILHLKTVSMEIKEDSKMTVANEINEISQTTVAREIAEDSKIPVANEIKEQTHTTVAAEISGRLNTTFSKISSHNQTKTVAEEISGIPNLNVKVKPQNITLTPFSKQEKAIARFQSKKFFFNLRNIM